MSEPENFLARWSRRKQETERKVDETSTDPRPVEARDDAPGVASDDITKEIWSDTNAPKSELDVAAKAAPIEAAEPVFDISTLPSLDAIDKSTDITPFLQKGVPLHLSREALRRAWTADPAIRDFIEVAENQWDFATGSDIPGFGPLEPTDDVAKLVAEVFNGRPSALFDELVPASADPSPLDSVESDVVSAEVESAIPSSESAALEAETVSAEMPIVEDGNILRREEENAALQQKQQNSPADVPIRRLHGRALPQ